MKELGSLRAQPGAKVKRPAPALHTTVYLLMKGNFLLFTPRKRSEVALRSWSRVALTLTWTLTLTST